MVAVRLPSGIYLPVNIAESLLEDGCGRARVVKDGGDDPDVTNRAGIRATVAITINSDCRAEMHDGMKDGVRSPLRQAGIVLIAGEGVGVATKPGLPVAPGEPAINPVPRQMFSDNLSRLLRACDPGTIRAKARTRKGSSVGPSVFVPFETPVTELFPGVCIEVTLEVAGGEALARHTLNPRLGVLGGISILGTTGIVKPFSHEAYEDTIRAAMSVAVSNGCGGVVLSTGGKSEKFAREMLPGEPAESFVQVADFFAFSVREARRFGFGRIVHSVFFGKAVKMAQGHEYTHAHSVDLDLGPVARIAKDFGHDDSFCNRLASANTARHALEIIAEREAFEIVEEVAAKALAQSVRLAGEGISVRLLLFDFNGALLIDLG